MELKSINLTGPLLDLNKGLSRQPLLPAMQIISENFVQITLENWEVQNGRGRGHLQRVKVNRQVSG